MRLLFCAGLAGLFLALGGAATAATPGEIASDISDEIMSPYCPGVTLHDCPSDAAVALRERMIDKAEQGWDKARILAWLEDEWGEQIRATPTGGAWGWLAWTLPAALALAGIALAWMLVRRWNRARPVSGDDRPSIPSEDRRRLQRELARLRSER